VQRAARSLVGFGYGVDSISFWVVSAERPVPPDEKSGLHFCFAAPDAAAVDTFHAAALRAGGHNGTPVCGQCTTLINMLLSSSTRTDIVSRLITALARSEG